MKNTPGKIILVDDEPYEKELLNVALDRLGLEFDIKYFTNGYDVLDYLKTTEDDIFMVVSDMDMPQMNGLELKRNIDSDPRLKKKAIPFIFQSSNSGKFHVEEAYNYGVQGYFEKPMNIEVMAKQLDRIVRYWSICRHPNNLHIATTLAPELKSS